MRACFIWGCDGCYVYACVLVVFLRCVASEVGSMQFCVDTRTR